MRLLFRIKLIIHDHVQMANLYLVQVHHARQTDGPTDCFIEKLRS